MKPQCNVHYTPDTRVNILSTCLFHVQVYRPDTHADFISMYRFFTLKICKNTDFFQEYEMIFLIVLLAIQIFVTKLQIVLIIDTDFVLDQSGRSGYRNSWSVS